jgi:hypothetical protein
MLDITNHQGNANQNHNELSPYTCWDDLPKEQQNKKKTGDGKDVKKEPLVHTLLVET